MTANDRLRWGIAGTGGIAAQMAAALEGLPDADLVAVGSRSIESGSAFAREHGVDRARTYDELWADDDVDIVYVASPHSEHRAMTLAALDHGRHVLCEKAFAVSAAEATEMAAAAARNDRFLMEAMWTWFIPATLAVRDRVDGGAIGDVRVLAADFGLAIGDESDRHRRLDLAGGALLDLGIYPVALSRFLLGAPTDVRAVGHLAPSGVDDNVGAVLGHEDGALTVFHTGLDALTTLGATIHGTEGSITIDPAFWCSNGFTVQRHDGDGERVDLPNDGLAHEASHAMDRIRSGHLESDVIPLASSIAMLSTLDDIRAQIGLAYPWEER